jgi:hypothetical protein
MCEGGSEDRKMMIERKADKDGNVRRRKEMSRKKRKGKESNR